MNLKSIIAAIAVAATSLPAQAALFDLTYDFNGPAAGGVLEAVVEGTLQMDGNTVVVSSVQDFATFDGTPLPAIPFLDSLDEVAAVGAGLDPILTLDGSFLDFAAGFDALFVNGFGFGVGSILAALGAQDIAAREGAIIGNTDSIFVLSAYSLTQQPAPSVPAPATIALITAGLAGAAYARRR